MSDQRSGGRRKPQHNAGAFLGPGGTFPAAMHTLSDEVPREPSSLEAERRGPRLKPRAALEAPGSPVWAVALAVGAWGLGSIILAVIIGILLAFAGVGAVSNDAATALGLSDLVLLVPAVYVAMKSERLTDRRDWVVVSVASASVAIVASLLLASLPLVMVASVGLLAGWALRHRRATRSRA